MKENIINKLYRLGLLALTFVFISTPEVAEAAKTAVAAGAVNFATDANTAFIAKIVKAVFMVLGVFIAIGTAIGFWLNSEKPDGKMISLGVGGGIFIFALSFAVDPAGQFIMNALANL